MTRAVVAAGAAILAGIAAAQQQSRYPVLAASDADGLPQRLADTGLYEGPGDEVDAGNRYYSPQYPLWSDGLTKRRWIYLPPGATIDATRDPAWQFPAGTRFWKEFSLNGRRIETRVLWRTSAGQWVGAAYAWNEEGTDARLAPDGVPGVVEVAPGRRHSIPSRTDCSACHGTESSPLGFNALQLSTDRDPNAIHGEPPRPGMLTNEDLVREGLLKSARTDLLVTPPRIRTSSPQTRAVLGYLAANCSMCHNGNGTIAALGPVIRYEELLKDGDAVAATLVGQATRWQIPGQPDGTSVVMSRGEPDRSAMVVRMRSRSPSSQMPPLGTAVRDQQAVDAISAWIRAR